MVLDVAVTTGAVSESRMIEAQRVRRWPRVAGSGPGGLVATLLDLQGRSVHLLQCHRFSLCGHWYSPPPPYSNSKGGRCLSEVGREGRSMRCGTTGRAIGTVTADASYAYSKVFGGLERRRIDPVIPTRKDPSRSPVPLRRFRYDARHHLVKCPRGKILHPVRRLGRGQVFLSRVSDCACCPLKGGCLPASRVNKEVVVPHDYPALLRARRRRARWSEDDQRLYQRHLWRSEGFHGEAKTLHGLGRAIRRGLDPPHRHRRIPLQIREPENQTAPT